MSSLLSILERKQKIKNTNQTERHQNLTQVQQWMKRVRHISPGAVPLSLMDCAHEGIFPLSNKVTMFNGTLWINDLIGSDGSTEINKAISVSNQSLIFVKSYVSYPLVMRYLHWCACFQLYHLRASHILRRSSARPCMCNTSAPSVPSGESERKGARKIGSRLSDDLPLQRRYLSSVLGLLSLMEQEWNTVEDTGHLCVIKRWIMSNEVACNEDYSSRGKNTWDTSNTHLERSIRKDTSIVQMEGYLSNYHYHIYHLYMSGVTYSIWSRGTNKSTSLQKIKETNRWESFE